MPTIYCNVRLFIVAKDGYVMATDENTYYRVPSTNDYDQLLYQELSYTDFALYKSTDIDYIVVALNWHYTEHEKCLCTMHLNPSDVWPTEFESEE